MTLPSSQPAPEDDATGDDITTVSSRVAYENRWMRVREDETRLRDGTAGLYGFVEKADFVIIAPIDRGLVHLVQQFRYPIRSRQWEFPQGSWEASPDIDPVEVARGELAEETGLRAGRIEEAGRLYPLYGTVTQSFRIFLASELSPGEARLEHSEQDLVSASVPLAEFERMIVEGSIRDAGTVAAFGLLRLKGLV
ncbi:NUDIX hydrolase [Bosea sp. BK604]|uniref:NUDIX domain-containing protein n=1 Tax=Bosea sp. BK604 TaxID=2512180 RepID=UPI0010EAB6C4|nr:NUDIX hydrolase [Bosea sp. BK604]TCR68608.1 NUDIX domain-containing protein [Bosea sp. BK604]